MLHGPVGLRPTAGGLSPQIYHHPACPAHHTLELLERLVRGVAKVKLGQGRETIPGGYVACLV